MTLVVDGYNNDPRELVDIPEVRALLRALEAAWPQWAYFFNQADDSSKLLLSCVAGSQFLGRGAALGWSGTGKAIERLKEVIGEIDLLTSTKPALAGEDGMLSLETPNFAINQIDMAPSSSCREAGSSAPGL